MRLSNYFLPLIKEKPSEAKIASHQLMLRAGMIRQQSSGIYSWLPLGCRVLKKVENIIRKNMDKAGFVEMLAPMVQSADIWRESGRYDAYGKETLRIRDRHDQEMLFGPSAEEVFTKIIQNAVASYKDLPKILYQIQWKFRDEIRPRFGVMRGREFLMKDAYSFDIDHDSAVNTYNKFYKAYIRTFRDMGLEVIPLRAENGAIGGDLSHEFHVVADTGESTLYFDRKFLDLKSSDEIDVEFYKSLYAAADDQHKPENCPINSDQIEQKRGIEVGHIFNFGTKYSEALGAYIKNKEGENTPLQMGSYGIGASRVVAAIIESSHDEKGIIWPEEVAPFSISILNLSPKDDKVNQLSENLYNKLMNAGIDVLYDDTSNRPGQKFATHDLIGSPWQVIIGSKKAAENMVELKNRASGIAEDIKFDDAINKLLRV